MTAHWWENRQKARAQVIRGGVGEYEVESWEHYKSVGDAMRNIRTPTTASTKHRRKPQCGYYGPDWTSDDKYDEAK